MGPERPTLWLGPTKTATHLARSRSVRIGVVRFEKSLVDNLSGKRQLSVAKLSTKRIFSLAKRDFLVANGRMAADFSSPEKEQVQFVLALTCLLNTPSPPMYPN